MIDDDLTWLLSRMAGLHETPEESTPADPPGTLYRIIERDTYTGHDREWWVAGRDLTPEAADAAVARAHAGVDQRYRYRKVPMSTPDFGG